MKKYLAFLLTLTLLVGLVSVTGNKIEASELQSVDGIQTDGILKEKDVVRYEDTVDEAAAEGKTREPMTFEKVYTAPVGSKIISATVDSSRRQYSLSVSSDGDKVAFVENGKVMVYVLSTDEILDKTGTLKNVLGVELARNGKYMVIKTLVGLYLYKFEDDTYTQIETGIPEGNPHISENSLYISYLVGKDVTIFDINTMAIKSSYTRAQLYSNSSEFGSSYAAKPIMVLNDGNLFLGSWYYVQNTVGNTTENGNVIASSLLFNPASKSSTPLKLNNNYYTALGVPAAVVQSFDGTSTSRYYVNYDVKTLQIPTDDSKTNGLRAVNSNTLTNGFTYIKYEENEHLAGISGDGTLVLTNQAIFYSKSTGAAGSRLPLNLVFPEEITKRTLWAGTDSKGFNTYYYAEGLGLYKLNTRALVDNKNYKNIIAPEPHVTAVKLNGQSVQIDIDLSKTPQLGSASVYRDGVNLGTLYSYLNSSVTTVDNHKGSIFDTKLLLEGQEVEYEIRPATFRVGTIAFADPKDVVKLKVQLPNGTPVAISDIEQSETIEGITLTWNGGDFFTKFSVYVNSTFLGESTSEQILIPRPIDIDTDTEVVVVTTAGLGTVISEPIYLKFSPADVLAKPKGEIEATIGGVEVRIGEIVMLGKEPWVVLGTNKLMRKESIGSHSYISDFSQIGNYNPLKEGTLAYFLNTEYYNTLSDEVKNVIVSSTFRDSRVSYSKWEQYASATAYPGSYGVETTSITAKVAIPNAAEVYAWRDRIKFNTWLISMEFFNHPIPANNFPGNMRVNVAGNIGPYENILGSNYAQLVYGVQPAIYIATDVKLTGQGTEEDPYYIMPGTINPNDVKIATPTNFKTITVSDTSALLTWDIANRATQYVITDLAGNEIYSGTDNIALIKNLSAGKNYAYMLRATSPFYKSGANFISFNTNSEFDPSNPLNGVGTIGDINGGVVEGNASPANSDVNLHVVDSTTSSIKVAWSAIENATSYKVFVNDVEVGNTADTIYELTALSVNTLYRVSILAERPTTNTKKYYVNAQTRAELPVDVTGFHSTRIYNDSVVMSWNEVTGADEYILKRDGTIVVYTGKLTTFKDSGLLANTSYTYTVEAKNSAGNSNAVSLNITTADDPVSLDVPAPEITEAKVTVSFKVIPDASMYYVERNPQWVFTAKGDGTFDVVYTNTTTGVTENLGNISPVDGTLSVEELGLEANTTYHYDITAVKPDANGNQQVIGSGTVTATTPPVDGSGSTPPADGGNGTPVVNTPTLVSDLIANGIVVGTDGSLTTGGNIVDVDGNGVQDKLIDIDNDGTYDGLDTNADGIIDLIDLDGDSNIDKLVDSNNDGIFDGIDLNNDNIEDIPLTFQPNQGNVTPNNPTLPIPDPNGSNDDTDNSGGNNPPTVTPTPDSNEDGNTGDTGNIGDTGNTDGNGSDGNTDNTDNTGSTPIVTPPTDGSNNTGGSSNSGSGGFIPSTGGPSVDLSDILRDGAKLTEDGRLVYNDNIVDINRDGFGDAVIYPNKEYPFGGIDIDGDGKPDLFDINNDGIKDSYIDTDSDGIPNGIDLDGDGVIDVILTSSKSKPQSNVEEKPKNSCSLKETRELPNFLDTEGHWSEEYINILYTYELVNGVSTDKFEPNRNITRAEFIAMTVRALCLETEDFVPVFEDVGEDSWYYEDVYVAFSNNIVKGISTTQFKPESNITREEAITIIGRVLESNDLLENSELTFTDITAISPWAIDYVDLVSSQELITGYPDGSLKPKGFATRAEVSKMMLKLVEIIHN